MSSCGATGTLAGGKGKRQNHFGETGVYKVESAFAPDWLFLSYVLSPNKKFKIHSPKVQGYL